MNHAHINLAGKDAGSGCSTILPADLRQPLVWKLADPALDMIKTAAMHNHTIFIIYFRFVLSKPNPAEQRRNFDFAILPLVLLMVVCKSVIPGSMLHMQ